MISNKNPIIHHNTLNTLILSKSSFSDSYNYSSSSQENKKTMPGIKKTQTISVVKKTTPELYICTYKFIL